MIQRAEWREDAVEPRTPLGVVLGQDRPRGVPASWIVFGTCLLYTLLHAVLDLFLVKGLADVLGYASGFGFLILFAALVGPSTKPSLAPDPAPGPSFRVGVSFFRGRRRTGEDEGMIALDDGWLVFEGHRTSFALRSSDARETIRVDHRWRLTLDEEQRLEIAVRGEPKEFRNALDRWRFHAPPPGLSRLPPLTPHRDAGVGVAAFLHAIGPMILGIMAGIALKDAVLGTFKPTEGSTLAWSAAVALVLSLLGRLLLWRRRRA